MLIYGDASSAAKTKSNETSASSTQQWAQKVKNKKQAK